MDQEIKGYIRSIIFTLIFFIVMTIYWFGPRKDLANFVANIGNVYESSDINLEVDGELNLDYKEITFRVINKQSLAQDYIIVINNDYFKQREEKCKKMSNKNLEYSLKIAENIQDNRVLSSDGIIYRDTLKPNEIKEFSIKIKTNQSENFSDGCFFPVLKISKNNEL